MKSVLLPHLANIGVASCNNNTCPALSIVKGEANKLNQKLSLATNHTFVTVLYLQGIKVPERKKLFSRFICNVVQMCTYSVGLTGLPDSRVITLTENVKNRPRLLLRTASRVLCCTLCPLSVHHCGACCSTDGQCKESEIHGDNVIKSEIF